MTSCQQRGGWVTAGGGMAWWAGDKSGGQPGPIVLALFSGGRPPPPPPPAPRFNMGPAVHGHIHVCRPTTCRSCAVRPPPPPNTHTPTVPSPSSPPHHRPHRTCAGLLSSSMSTTATACPLPIGTMSSLMPRNASVPVTVTLRVRKFGLCWIYELLRVCMTICGPLCLSRPVEWQQT